MVWMFGSRTTREKGPSLSYVVFTAYSVKVWHLRQALLTAEDTWQEGGCTLRDFIN